MSLQSVAKFGFLEQSTNMLLLKTVVVVLCYTVWLMLTERSVNTEFRVLHARKTPTQLAYHMPLTWLATTVETKNYPPTSAHSLFQQQSKRSSVRSAISLCCDYYILITTDCYLLLSINTNYHRLVSPHLTPEQRSITTECYRLTSITLQYFRRSLFHMLFPQSFLFS